MKIKQIKDKQIHKIFKIAVNLVLKYRCEVRCTSHTVRTVLTVRTVRT